MSKTDITIIDENGDLREKAHIVHGQRVSEPDKLSEQTIIRDENGDDILARKVDANVKIEDIPGLGDKLDVLYRTDAALQEQITENTNNIEAEAELRHTQDDALLAEIMAETSARQDADTEIKQNTAAIQQALNAEVVRATDAENALTANKIDKSVLPDALVEVAVESQESAVLLNTKSKSTTTGATTTTTDALPVANSEHHGVMSKEAYAQLQELETRTAALEGASRRYPVHLGTEPLTQAQYQQAYELAANAPGQTPPDGATLVNLDNNHAITYFENAGATNEHWIDRGIDTVAVATNLIVGIVKGTESTAGKIFVELDGSMSVNGWDALVSSVQTHIADAVRHITADERTAWNSKQAALTAGQIAAVNSGISSTKVTQYDGYAAGKQDKLISGTNIKTVNGKDLLGSGNIPISAEGSWGNITGDITEQSDLLSALAAKQNTLQVGNSLSLVGNTIGLSSIIDCGYITNPIEENNA